jgi:hypothetical protein
MAKYLGETPTPLEDHFKTKEELVLYYIGFYGQIDGAHHKQWVLDQVVRIMKGCEFICTIAKWDDGLEELRVTNYKAKLSKEYKDWVKMMKGDNNEYEYDEGIAP